MDGKSIRTETVLRALRLLAMVAWVGGLAFFAFVRGSVAFHSLPSPHEAGLVVGGTLRELHWIGLVGGVVFCLATGWLWLWAEVPARGGFAIQLVLTAVMLLTTAYSQFSILPAMERDRLAAGGDRDAAGGDNPRRGGLRRLHVPERRPVGPGFVVGGGGGAVRS